MAITEDKRVDSNGLMLIPHADKKAAQERKIGTHRVLPPWVYQNAQGYFSLHDKINLPIMLSFSIYGSSQKRESSE